MSELHHECGIAGLYLLPGQTSRLISQSQDVARLIPRMLLDLQNRGQLAAGFSTYHPQRDQIVDTYKEVGSVIEAFRLNHRGKFENIMREYEGPAGIGHVRYATCGKDDRSYAQPMERHHGCKWKWFSFAFNGQLANYHDLASDMLHKEDYHLTRQIDTEVIMHYISFALRKNRVPLRDLFEQLTAKFDGAYNMLFINAMGELAALRDPLGIRPLCIGQDGGLVGFASESVALLNLGFTEIRDLKPGELVTIEDGRLHFYQLGEPQTPAHCFFEWVYFANVASMLDERSVYQVRSRLGRELARRENIEIDDDTIVVPVPDTAKAAADSMAYALQCPSREGLIRNRYVGRTFIQGSDRGDKVRLKYTPVRPVLEGKKVLLVEDTIVRSTTMRALIRLMKEKGGAREIHVRVACPPITSPCFYGIDMSTVRELFATQFIDNAHQLNSATEQRMAQELEADSLSYLPVEAIADSIQMSPDHLCRACVTGEYPTPKGRELYQIALEQTEPNENGARTYDAPTAPPRPVTQR